MTGQRNVKRPTSVTAEKLRACVRARVSVCRQLCGPKILCNVARRQVPIVSRFRGDIREGGALMRRTVFSALPTHAQIHTNARTHTNTHKTMDFMRRIAAKELNACRTTHTTDNISNGSLHT